jgi:hypothetical protein
MALEYIFHSAADATPEDFRSVIAAAVGGAVAADGTIFLEGMYVIVYSADPTEAQATTRLFGFDHRISALFRFSNLSSPATARHNTVLMVVAVLSVFDRFAQPGVLLFNGEQAVLQKLDGGVVFDEDWEDWSEVDEVTPFVAAHTRRRLAQPLL